MFINEETLKQGTWQSFERAIARLLLYEKFEGIRIVGQTGDRGADLIAHKFSKRWLFQMKHWKNRLGLEVVDQTLEAVRVYKAHIPVIVALNGFTAEVHEHQRRLMSRGIPLQLWDTTTLLTRVDKLPHKYPVKRTAREYQEAPIRSLVHTYSEGLTRKSLIVMATGLGKTFTACEAVRRINSLSPVRVLVIVHTNELVYQFERAFWSFLTPLQETLVWNGYEKPATQDLERVPFTFACLNTVADYLKRGNELPQFDIFLVDECHHVGGQMYETVLGESQAGQEHGPFLIGLTATPWRPDETDISDYFGKPLASIDIVTGLKKGFLANVDYRMHTDNINWEALSNLEGSRFSPKQVNHTLFINEWDNAVVVALQAAWKEQHNSRAIVFCGTIDHAIIMADKINALGFCNAAAIYSQTVSGLSMKVYERNRILSDFHDGTIDVVCAVDIFNEGVDVPDVNIIVFQRVTHSRRIFVQQLGRGLRISPGKEKVIVLDFVSDIRRFAAGFNLQKSLQTEDGPAPGKPVRISLQHSVTFRRIGGEDPKTESFLRQWLEDVAAVENAGEDTIILKFPPSLPEEHK